MSAIPALATGDALLIVDPQNDFLPGGSLGIDEGHAVIPVLNAWIAAAEAAGVPIFVSRDWHPSVTTHFAAHGGAWPAHCVQGTPGAEWHTDLHVPAAATVVSKGMGETEDAYSAFQARDAHGTPLNELLAARSVRQLYVMGLATDYCVRASSLDALTHGLRVSLVEDGMRAVDLTPGDGLAALAEMRAAGARTVT